MQMSLLKRFTNLVLFGISSSVTLFVLVLISSFISWLLIGWLSIANVDWEFPTNFLFKPCRDNGVCSYPTATIDLRTSTDRHSVLASGLSYTASLRLSFSDSVHNREAGLFLVHFSLHDADGRTLSSCSTSTSIPYRSRFTRWVRRLIFWPLLIFNLLNEYHSLLIKCPEPIGYVDTDRPATIVKVEIQTVHLGMANDGRLLLSTKLTGLQYYLYWWPISSSVVIFLTVFWCAAVASLIIWLFSKLRADGDGSNADAQPSKSSTSKSALSGPIDAIGASDFSSVDTIGDSLFKRRTIDDVKHHQFH